MHQEKFIIELQIPHQQFTLHGSKMVVITQVLLGTFSLFFFNRTSFLMLSANKTHATTIERGRFAKKCRRALLHTVCEQQKSLYGFGKTYCCPVFSLLTCNTFFCTSLISFSFLTLSAFSVHNIMSLKTAFIARGILYQLD